MKGAALAHHQGEAIQLLRKRTGPELQDLGNVIVSSAFSAAISRAASGEASVLRRMCTVPTLEIVAPVAASLRPTAATKRSIGTSRWSRCRLVRLTIRVWRHTKVDHKRTSEALATGPRRFSSADILAEWKSVGPESIPWSW
jgi:hypothetical protein